MTCAVTAMRRSFMTFMTKIDFSISKYPAVKAGYFFVGNLKALVYDTTLVRRFNSSATINVMVSANGIASQMPVTSRTSGSR